MTKSDKSKSRLAAGGFLLGLWCGVTWFIALLPIGISGLFLYDMSRYGFSVSVVVAMVSLYSSTVRKFGVSPFFVGLLVAVLFLVFPFSSVPIQQFAFLYGIPLAMVLVPTMVILWLSGRGRAGNMRIENTVSAPSRFGIGTVMVIVLASCVLLSLANRLGFSPVFTVTVGIFLAVICGLQMLTNQVPRAVSIGTGAVLFPVAIALSWKHYGLSGHPMFGMLVKNPSDIVYMGAHLLTIGAVLGYAGGTLVAGLFLIVEYCQRLFRSNSRITPDSL